MKIVDFHLHAGKFSLLREDIQELLTRKPFDEGHGIDQVFSHPDNLMTYISDIGVEYGIVLAECGPGTNFSIDSEMTVQFCKDDDRLIPFGSINPNYHSPIAEFEKSIELGVKGFKLYPADHAFDPFTPEMMTVYRYCEELSLPLMFHTGLTAQKNTEQKHIRPAEYEALAKKYPDLMLILSHTGNPHWYDEALLMIEQYDNVYVDTGLVPIDNWSKIYSLRPGAREKVLFGSDFPVCGSYRMLINSIRELEMEPSLKEMIMYKNGAALLQKMGSAKGQSRVDMILN